MSDSQEPTMEEILASIRRIISEDEAPADEAAPEPDAEAKPEPEPAAAAPEPAPEPEPVHHAEEEVLELTEVAPEPATLGDLEISEPTPEPPAPEPAPEPESEPVAHSPAPAHGPEEGLLSDSAAASVASAFGSLSHRIGMPAPSTTLDGVVRELLKPLLKEWLDQHLRAIVEAKVEEEVERQSRRARV